nr:hypothetical protein [Candidatus Sigynarchaeota archaeon]
MAYNCEKCGETISETQYYKFQAMCPACVRKFVHGIDESPPRAGTIQGSPGEKIQAFVAAHKDHLFYAIIAGVYIMLIVFCFTSPSLSSVWGSGITILSIVSLCIYTRIKERPRLEKKEH